MPAQFAIEPLDLIITSFQKCRELLPFPLKAMDPPVRLGKGKVELIERDLQIGSVSLVRRRQRRPTRSSGWIGVSLRPKRFDRAVHILDLLVAFHAGKLPSRH
ncbi:MAG: hypothetical protein HC871_00180 [Rhizobiales bacterium]|nr:hypothetical protein [Hyphomicrobiales bacterium]